MFLETENIRIINELDCLKVKEEPDGDGDCVDEQDDYDADENESQLSISTASDGLKFDDSTVLENFKYDPNLRPFDYQNICNAIFLFI